MVISLQKEPPASLNMSHGVTNQEGRIAQLLEPNHRRPDRRLVTIYTELHQLQTNFPYNFSFIQITK